MEQSMPHRPIGDHVMTPAERQQRRRDKLKALRNAAPQPADPVLAFLTQHPDAVADGIYRRVPELARGIAMALKWRLWQAGSRPDWQRSTRATTRGANLSWMGR